MACARPTTRLHRHRMCLSVCADEYAHRRMYCRCMARDVRRSVSCRIFPAARMRTPPALGLLCVSKNTAGSSWTRALPCMGVIGDMMSRFPEQREPAASIHFHLRPGWQAVVHGASQQTRCLCCEVACLRHPHMGLHVSLSCMAGNPFQKGTHALRCNLLLLCRCLHVAE